MLVINKIKRVQKDAKIKVQGSLFPYQHPSHPTPTGKNCQLFLVCTSFQNSITHARIHTNVFIQLRSHYIYCFTTISLNIFWISSHRETLISYFLPAIQNSIVSKYDYLFNHSPTDGNLGCFQFLLS